MSGPKRPKWLANGKLALQWSQGSRVEEWSYGLTAVHRKINSRRDEHAASTTYYRSFRFTEDLDPAIALATARAQLRESS